MFGGDVCEDAQSYSQYGDSKENTGTSDADKRVGGVETGVNEETAVI